LRTEVPHAGRKDVAARVQQGSYVKGFVPPVLKVSARRAFANPLTVDVEPKAIVGADVDDLMSRLRGDLDDLAEVIHAGAVHCGWSDPTRS
jgi:hypothetical protein